MSAEPLPTSPHNACVCGHTSHLLQCAFLELSFTTPMSRRPKSRYLVHERVGITTGSAVASGIFRRFQESVT